MIDCLFHLCSVIPTPIAFIRISKFGSELGRSLDTHRFELGLGLNLGLDAALNPIASQKPLASLVSIE